MNAFSAAGEPTARTRDSAYCSADASASASFTVRRSVATVFSSVSVITAPSSTIAQSTASSRPWNRCVSVTVGRGSTVPALAAITFSDSSWKCTTWSATTVNSSGSDTIVAFVEDTTFVSTSSRAPFSSANQPLCSSAAASPSKPGPS